MKIIKKGVLPKEVKKNRNCYKCLSVLEYEPKDIKYDRGGEYIICPVCKAYLPIFNF